ncbi:adaptor protein MecA [Streptococcus infantis]|uniref:adaptor protein MecA n=1 Tax=Streptococcus infantis TaxID=68892 RepID=UPI0020C88FB1|nr:adaptor protein MecA [Streptococcus infantis]MCP9056377.1 adaptor protein MecA [Streptococcus infantis]MCP9080467.1 adaptor protein MecA [Streptococcus infantis]
MKMKQISDTTLKITMSLEDLMDRGMEISDFLVPQEKTEEFFYAILDELEMPDSFLDTGMLSFRVTPKPDKVDVFVTKSKIDQNLDFEDLADLPDMDELAKMSPDEFLKTLEKTMAEKTKEDIEAIQSLEQVEKEEEAAIDEIAEVDEGKREPYIYYILRFDDLTSLVSFAKTVDYQMEASELYKMNDQYYLTVLVDVEDHPSLYPAWLLARMREFADDSDISRSVLQEYGQVIINHDAVQGLQKV